MSSEPSQFDPMREAAQMRIRVIDRTDGGKEFILPALRNFRVKIAFSILRLFFLPGFVLLAFLNVRVVDELPGLLRFIVANHTYFFMGILGLIQLLLTYVCLDLWLRSSRVIAVPGELRVVTHWLLFRRTVAVAADKILEITARNTTSVNEDLYYDIVVATVGSKKGWLATYFPATRKAGGAFTENDLKAFNSGGRRIYAATGILGQAEADWMVSEIRKHIQQI